jgi:hypothetical protein
MWQPKSPMWWHRSAGHRALVVLLVAGFYLAVLLSWLDTLADSYR